MDVHGGDEVGAGVRPGLDGLLVDPSIPRDWDGFEVQRIWRGATDRISVLNPVRCPTGVASLVVDGSPGEPIPARTTVEVTVTVG